MTFVSLRFATDVCVDRAVHTAQSNRHRLLDLCANHFICRRIRIVQVYSMLQLQWPHCHRRARFTGLPFQDLETRTTIDCDSNGIRLVHDNTVVGQMRAKSFLTMSTQ